MAARGSWNDVPRENWHGRLKNARDQLRSAHHLLDLAAADTNGNPAMSAALLGVIAYADALSIKSAGIQNSDDHGQLPRALQRALGERLPNDQRERLGRLLSQKNEIQYTHRSTTLKEAKTFMEQADRFARWAEQMLALE